MFKLLPDEILKTTLGHVKNAKRHTRKKRAAPFFAGVWMALNMYFGRLKCKPHAGCIIVNLLQFINVLVVSAVGKPVFSLYLRFHRKISIITVNPLLFSGSHSLLVIGGDSCRPQHPTHIPLPPKSPFVITHHVLPWAWCKCQVSETGSAKPLGKRAPLKLLPTAGLSVLSLYCSLGSLKYFHQFSLLNKGKQM